MCLQKRILKFSGDFEIYLGNSEKTGGKVKKLKTDYFKYNGDFNVCNTL